MGVLCSGLPHVVHVRASVEPFGAVFCFDDRYAHAVLPCMQTQRL